MDQYVPDWRERADAIEKIAKDSGPMIGQFTDAPTPDMRWRPMWTAPIKDTTIEVRFMDGKIRFMEFSEGLDIPEESDAWRLAHPEWNEEDTCEEEK